MKKIKEWFKDNPTEARLIKTLFIVGTIIILYTGVKTYQSQQEKAERAQREWEWEQGREEREELERKEKEIVETPVEILEGTLVSIENYDDYDENDKYFMDKYYWFKIVGRDGKVTAIDNHKIIHKPEKTLKLKEEYEIFINARGKVIKITEKW